MAEKVHMCETCGKTTEKFGHLCNPVELDEAYVCDHCGQASTDPRHICKPKLQHINFVCIACGRVAELPSQLCNPRDIELMRRQDPPTRITQTLLTNLLDQEILNLDGAKWRHIFLGLLRLTLPSDFLVSRVHSFLSCWLIQSVNNRF